MSDAPRILLVEDQASDAELIGHELRKVLPDCELRRIDHRAGLERELASYRPHLVVSDHNLPQFTGAEALGVLMALHPETPFILVTGSLDEETAVEYMKAGAADYVLKDRLTRLGAAALAALDRRREREAAARVDAARRALDERYRLVVQATNDVIWDWDIAADTVWWSDNVGTVLGYTAEQLRATPLAAELAHPDDRAQLTARLAAALEQGDRAFESEYRLRLPDGTFADVVTRAHVLRDGDQPVRMIGALTDVSDRVHAQRKYRDIFAQAPVGIYQSSRTGHIIEANPALAHMLGYGAPDDLFDLDMARDIYHDAADREALIIASETSETPDVEARWKRRDGSTLWVQLIVQRHLDAAGQVIYYEGFVRDITDRKRLEDQLRQAQKMEAIGQLAGGIAHDFNNLLTAITGYAELLYETIDDGDPRREDVSEIKQAADRAAQLTRQLLAFSRKQVLQPRALDLNGVLVALEKMLSRLLGERITMRTVLSKTLGTVRADPGQVEQVIMNLAVNARDAMPDGGELTLETANVDLDEDYARDHVGVHAGPHVMLAVRDTGTGMDPATQARLFEPFFTTKGLGKGTGLGLSTVYGIVKQSDGYIWVYSEAGRGTTFKIYLPRVDQPADIMPANHAVTPPARGSETVLLVEDADLLRALARRVLESYGYTVLAPRTSAEALEIGLTHTGAIDLLLTDVVMPDVSGADLARQISAARTGIAVLYMSGYTDDAIVREGILDDEAAFIQKPFTAERLARKVREVLDGMGSGGAGSRTAESGL